MSDPTAVQRIPEDPNRHLTTRLLAASAVLLAVFFLLGCGSSEEGGDETSTSGEGSEEVFAPTVVTDADIEAAEEGSPERSLLEWWRAFQFQDVAGVEALTSKNTLDEVGKNALAELVSLRGRGLQGIEILDSTEQGDVASVRVGLLTFTPEKEGDPPPSTPTASVPATFAMVDEGGEWLFDGTAYLQPQIESLAASQEQAEQGQPPADNASSGG